MPTIPATAIYHCAGLSQTAVGVYAGREFADKARAALDRVLDREGAGDIAVTGPTTIVLDRLADLRDCPICPAQAGEPCLSPATGEIHATHRGRR